MLILILVITVKSDQPLKVGGFLGAVLLACGLTWLWDFISSLYFPGIAAWNLTIVSLFFYAESSLIGAYSLTRHIIEGHIRAGVRVGLAVWALNLAFRLILFNLAEALWGLIIYFVGFLLGGVLGGFLGKRLGQTSWIQRKGTNT